jgi:DNA polymerase-3 subunit beta
MDFILPKKDLLRLVARCNGVADKRSAMPALANVHLAVANNELRASATDLYLGVSGTTYADVIKSGSVAVPAKDLLERIKAMPDGPVQCLVNAESQMTLKAVGSPRRYTLSGINGSEFPQLPKAASDAATLKIPLEALALLIARTHFSISSDETRPNVNSGLFEWKGSVVRMVSTDGHRLSKMDLTVAASDASLSMLLPLKAVNELKRLCEEAKGDKATNGKVSITHSGPNAFFDIAGMTFSVKLVDAQVPPYEQVIPATSDHSVRAPRLALRDALKAVSLAASDRTGAVKLSFATNTLRIVSESPETGNGFDELAIDYSGPELTVGFNAKYILDALDAISNDEVNFSVSGELDPAVVKPASEEDGQSYTAVLMPMRTT